MDLKNWLKNVLDREPVYEKDVENALGAYKCQYQRLEKDAIKLKNMQMENIPTFHYDSSSADTQDSALVEAAWRIGCDPMDIHKLGSEITDELIELNLKYKAQLDHNLLLRRSIQRVERIFAQYKEDTNISQIDSIEEKIETLHKKRLEYDSIVSNQSKNCNDVPQLVELINLLKESEQLDKLLQEFCHLPPTILDALTVIANAEAELAEVEEELSVILQAH